ncbi:hypothetical protein AF332_11250 [Sporosarcina globispora]|uniref:Uncharacterized protein n=1 Tax=Sporosarcina globispora TaxID=1459 RepID=A0A0M0GBQ3_SPOGL|nr:hypothetical protein [Sporosarcina globispora]KON87345.1 hypothetical protein AF332_11250 [Sporosarcina globispora]
MTTYDQIWQTFLNNCKVSDIDLPNTPEKIYEQIRNATMHFNNRLRKKIMCDDITETVSEELSEDSLLILAHYIRLLFLVNQKTYFESLWQPFSSDVGLRNFGTQLRSLETSVKEQERTIDTLIMYTEEDFL